jgi:DNA modification methylase
MILQGDCRDVLRALDAESVQCCVTSPPYWGLRDYGVDGQLGLESTPDEYVSGMVDVFREVRRVLRPDGTLWLNLGDSYASDTKGTGGDGSTSGLMRDGRAESGRESKVAAVARQTHKGIRVEHGLKPKDLVGIPWRVAFALQADGWWLRSDIIWSKPNPMPESVTDRPTKAHEYVFLLTKSERYFYDADAIAEEATGREPGNVSHKHTVAYEAGDEYSRTKGGLLKIGARDTRNARSVWSIATKPFSDWTPTVRQIPVAWDGVSDGTKRTPSEDCPVHGSLDRLHPTLERDAHAAYNCYRSPGSGGRHVQEQLSGYAPTVLTRVLDSTDDSSGSPRRSHSPSATARSNRSRRTAPDPATTAPCTPSSQTDNRTERTSGEPGSSERRPGTNESSTAAVELVDSRGSQSSGSIADTGESPELIAASFGEALKAAGCTCSYYTETTEKVSHFAVFPPELARRCIVAGSRPGDTVLDPFNGAGTTGLVAQEHGRAYVGIELNPEYIEIAERRLAQQTLWMDGAA